jgi:hypothetical protein
VIETLSRIYVRGANITVDGLTAPAPGITVRNHGLVIAGSLGAHDVIIRGSRIHVVNDQPGKEDGISIQSRAFNVVVDRVSVQGASDESIGINDARNVTVSWSILAEPRRFHPANMLISAGATRASVHHNLFIKAARRNPWVAYSALEEAPEIQADVRHGMDRGQPRGIGASPLADHPRDHRVEPARQRPARHLAARLNETTSWSVFDIYAMASHRESVSRVLSAAMYRALPIVAAAVNGGTDLVVHEETGLLVPPHDPPALAAAIDRLAADPELAARLGARARQKVRVGGFFVLAILFLRFLRHGRQMGLARAACLSVLGCLAVSVASELIQIAIPTRTAAVGDLVLDLAGAVPGIVAGRRLVIR